MPRETKNVPRLSHELGSTGLKEQGGYIREDFLLEFVGSRKYKILREMLDNEPLIAGVDYAIRQLIKQVKWSVKPASESAEDVALAEFVESCLHDMEVSWPETLDEILSMIGMGFSVHEILYKVRVGPQETTGKYRSRYRDGKVGWRKLPIRAQETIEQWEFDNRGDLLGCVQRTEKNFGDAVTIPYERMLLFRTTSYKNNPEGKSIYRASYVPYYYKKRIQNIEAIGVERELHGLPVVEIPAKLMMANASAAEKAAYADWKNLVKNVRQDNQAGAVVPSDMDPKTGAKMYDFKLLSATGRRAIDVEMVLSRLNKEILLPVQADFMLLGHESVGSYALSSDKTHLFATAVAGFMGQVLNVFNNTAIPRLLSVNNIYPKELPKLHHGDLETENAKELADAVAALSKAGLNITGPKMQNQILERMGFEGMDANEEIKFVEPQKTQEPKKPSDA